MNARLSSIVSLVANVLPIAQELLGIVNAFRGVADTEPQPVQEVLDVIGKLTPIASALISQIETIRTQTEPDYPEVWAKVRDPWIDAVAEFNRKYPPA